MTAATSTSTASSPADRVRALAGEQLARDGWSRDRLLELQRERLRALVAHAVAASPTTERCSGRTQPRATCRCGSCRRCPRRR
jgi:hypothetical protein